VERAQFQNQLFSQWALRLDGDSALGRVTEHDLSLVNGRTLSGRRSSVPANDPFSFVILASKVFPSTFRGGRILRVPSRQEKST
jgi:hypothetical protein